MDIDPKPQRSPDAEKAFREAMEKTRKASARANLSRYSYSARWNALAGDRCGQLVTFYQNTFTLWDEIDLSTIKRTGGSYQHTCSHCRGDYLETELKKYCKGCANIDPLEEFLCYTCEKPVLGRYGYCSQECLAKGKEIADGLF